LVRLGLVLVIGGASCAPASDHQPRMIPITTNSEEARDSFLKGRNLVERLRVRDSRSYFAKALEHDPDFALAHLYSAFAHGNNPKRFFTHLGEAMALADQVSEGESLWIRGFAAGVSEPVKRLEYYT